MPAPLEQELFLGALKSLAHALQAKDPYTAGHALRVSLVAKAVARELGLSPPEVRQIGFAAELHDIGKIGVSERLLHKRGRLTNYEYHEVMRHTIIGEQIVAPLMGVDLTVREVVRWHHERMNGTGTPDGLSGDDIPLAARVVAVADAFDAMTSARPYRAALSLDAARRELLENAGTQFDPECVEALVRLVPSTPDSPLPTIFPAYSDLRAYWCQTPFFHPWDPKPGSNEISLSGRGLALCRTRHCCRTPARPGHDPYRQRHAPDLPRLLPPL